MLHARLDNVLRVWFQVRNSDGTLRNGINNNDIELSVISFDDSARIGPMISESLQRAGNYYFDIPSSFFMSNGIGDYFISIEIDTSVVSGSGEPIIVDSSSKMLQVYLEDFNSLSGSVWNSSFSNFNQNGTMGSLINRITPMSQSIETVRKFTTGRWRIINDQMVFYDDNGITPIATFDLLMQNGDSFFHPSSAPTERRPI